tara:strand:- start:6607 stop:7245 length:639 start_codon:yes stop_codon:yes gene_type:complete
MGLETMKKSSAAAARKNKTKRASSIINRRLVRNLLRTRDGEPRTQKHAITGEAYRAVSQMGHSIMKDLISVAKRELSAAPKAVSLPTRSIAAGHIVHAANYLKVPPSLTNDAINSATQKTYDPTACKASNVRRMAQHHEGKTRVRKETVPVLWCLVSRLIQELIDEAVKDGEEKNRNIRLRPQILYKAIERKIGGSLSPFKKFVGPGQGLGL